MEGQGKRRLHHLPPPEEAFEAVVAAARSSLPEQDRKPLEAAVEQVPHLVRTESDPLQFLLLCDGNVVDAAQRLVAYWTKRLETFGDDRYLLPLRSLSGSGALSEDDVETLRTGFLLRLPYNGDDAEGGQEVLFLDNTRTGPLLEGRSRREARLRCLFYLASVSSDDLDGGGLLRPLVLVRYSTSPQMYLGKAGRVLGLLEALPRRVEKFWNVYDPPPGARRMFQDTVVPLFEDFPGKERFTSILASYVASSQDDLHRWLHDRGISPEQLPPSAGGSFSPEEHTRWMDDRVKQDRSPPKKKDASKTPSSPALAPSPVPAPSQGSNKKRSLEDRSPDPDSAEVRQLLARMERRRQNDLIYSRNRRQRVRQEERRLQTDCYVLSRENTALRNEGERLSKLLDEAKALVWEMEQQQDAAAVTAAAASAQPSTNAVPQLHPSVEALRLLLGRPQLPAATAPLLSPSAAPLRSLLLPPQHPSPLNSISALAQWQALPRDAAPVPSSALAGPAAALGAPAGGALHLAVQQHQQQQQEHLLEALLAGRGAPSSTAGTAGLLSLLGLSSSKALRTTP